MKSEERKKYYGAALQEQRHLLQRSIDGMASGELAEALNVATRIRTLVHEAGRNKPLLKYLKNNYLDMPMRDIRVNVAPAGPPGTQSITFFVPLSVSLGVPEGKLTLMKELNDEEYEDSTLGRWWTNVFMNLPGIGPVTRKEIILGVADKEGGAHVDADISAKYEAILTSKMVVLKAKDVDVEPLRFTRLATGRAGLEMLKFLEANFPIKAMEASSVG
jgi:hypothetical protein